MRQIKWAVVVLMFGLAGCGGGGPSSRADTQQPTLISGPLLAANDFSGIEGTVYATETDTSGNSVRFNRRPLAGAQIDVFRSADTTPIARVVTDAQGTFRVALEPGTYVLVPRATPGDGEVLHAAETTVTVPAGGIAPARLEYEGDRFGAGPVSQ